MAEMACDYCGEVFVDDEDDADDMTLHTANQDLLLHLIEVHVMERLDRIEKRIKDLD